MVIILYIYLITATVDQSLKEYFPVIAYFKVIFAGLLFIDLVKNRFWVFKTPLIRNKYLFIPLLNFFFLVSLISFVINWGSVPSALQFIISITRPFVIFYWVVTSKEIFRIENFLLHLIVFTIVIQIPFFVNGILQQGTGYFGDAAIGTNIHGGAFGIGGMSWIGAMYFFFMAFYKKKYGNMFFSLVCVVILAITSTKMLFLILPISMVTPLIVFKRISLKSIIVIIMISIFSGGAYFYAEENYMGQSKEVDTDINEILAASEKFEGYHQLFFDLPLDLPIPFIGAGPGQFASYAAQQYKTPLANKYINSYSDLIPEGTRGILTDRSSGIITFIGELGWAGLIIIMMIYIKTIINTIKLVLATQEINDLIMCSVVIVMGIAIITQSFFYNIFETNQFLLNAFWILSGIIIARNITPLQFNYGYLKNTPAVALAHKSR